MKGNSAKLTDKTGSKFKRFLRAICFIISLIFGVACIFGYETQNRKNLLIIFCTFFCFPFSICLLSYLKEIIKRCTSKKKAIGIPTEATDEKVFSDNSLDVSDIEASIITEEKKSEVICSPLESSDCFKIINTDEEKKTEIKRDGGIWWDKELVERYMALHSEFRYDEPFGRIFLDSVWYVDGDDKEPAVIEKMREIEKRGGRIHRDVSGCVTHYIGTESKDVSGFSEKMAVKYGAKIITDEEFHDVISIADCTAEKNRSMFTPSYLFKVTKEALSMTEDEDKAKYVFIHKAGDGLVLTWLDEKKEKQTILWNGDSVENFWNSIGDFLFSSILVAVNPIEDVLKPLCSKLYTFGIETNAFNYIDLARFCGTTLKHEDREQLRDIRYLTHLLGQTPPESDKELSDAVCAAFMVFIIDHDKPALEYISTYEAKNR